MRTQFYLVISENGTVKALKNAPDLKWNEVAVLTTLTLPNSLFQKPQLQATITVADSKVQPMVIDAEMTDNIQQAIQTAAGVQVRLTIDNPGEQP